VRVRIVSAYDIMRGGTAFASGLRLSSHHFQMRDGVCIERNEYHVNTSYIHRFDYTLKRHCYIFRNDIVFSFLAARVH
jgi:hypothetical protein